MLKGPVTALLPGAIQPYLAFVRSRIAIWTASLQDRLTGACVQSLPVPPARLRFRVHGAADSRSFLEGGLVSAGDIADALKRVDRQILSFERILDFGCGCARTLRWFQDLAQSAQLIGTDIDPEAIAWCRTAMPFARFELNPPLPPLPFPAEHFDLVYAVSVFTHLDEDYQQAWLKELHRVARPGALLIVTVHGAHAQGRSSALSRADRETIRRRGFLYKVRLTGRFKADGLPDFYQVAYQTREYVTDEFSRLFRIHDYIERGLGDHQDLVLMER